MSTILKLGAIAGFVVAAFFVVRFVLFVVRAVVARYLEKRGYCIKCHVNLANMHFVAPAESFAICDACVTKTWPIEAQREWMRSKGTLRPIHAAEKAA